MTRVGEELKKKSINAAMFAAFLGVTEKTAMNKMTGATRFTVDEAVKTKKELFPELDFEWLFNEGN